MENEQTVEQILALVEQMLQAAGPEWTMQFLQAGLEEAANAGGEQPMGAPPPQGAPPMETVSRGGPGSMGKIAPMKTGLGMN